jgi:hypothetical protein
MSRSVTVGLVALTAIVGVLVGMILPTALAQKEERPAPSGRYDARLQPVFGGLGGALIEVTDHQTNTLYLYLAQAEWGKEKEAKPVEEAYELVGKIDLTSAGQARLKVTDLRPKENKTK